MAELTGQTFAGYEILGKLGEGGFGAVYKARQPNLNRLVALKILAPHLAADAEFVVRFKREATLAASFNHPNLVLVFAAGESDGSQFMAMEFIEGETLRRRIEEHGRLQSREALAIAVYIAQALQYAWNKSRLIHRDIKPDNVFLSKTGEVKVGDLGLAKNAGQTTVGMTATGVMMGSPHYISPEQANARKEIDFRADIYSLGCTLYQMLTGRTPYEGNDPMSVMNLHVNAPPPAIFKTWPQCPMPLGLLVGKMLKKNPRERHASYEELIAELTAVHDKIVATQVAAAAPPSGTITFLFTDVEGSTQLWEQHSQAMPLALERHNQILRRTMESHGGFVFKTVGDAFCVAFASAPNAMAAALATQRALAAELWGATGPLRVRMALHTGAAEERGSDYFGPTVNRVARVLAAGHGGQILLSNATEQLVRDHLTEGVSLGDLGERSLKNLTRAERIFQINLPDLPTQFPTLRATAGHSTTHRRRQRLMIYGGAGAAAAVLVGGLLLWSPWKSSSSQDSNTPSPQRTSTPSLQHSISPSSSAALKQLGNVFTNAVGAEMVYIPPGEFLLGSTKEEQTWAVENGEREGEVKREGEAPRKARIKQGFWMGRTEVTVGQWKQFAAATGYPSEAEKAGQAWCQDQRTKTWTNMVGRSWQDPNFGAPPKDNHPVCCVSWNDAAAFCAWLTDQERKAGRLSATEVVRLPTEAEWEYACRAGTQTKFWWGEAQEDGKGRLNWSGAADGFQWVSPVDHYGDRGRNAFGLADMLGNLYEWCLDEYDPKLAHEEYYDRNSGARLRVLRGGAFSGKPVDCRCANRRSRLPSTSDSGQGFRVVMGVDVSGATTSTPSSPPAAAPKEGGILAPAETRVSTLTTNPQVGEVCALALGGATLELVGIPPGEFMLGSTKEEQAWAAANGLRESSVKPEGEAPRTTRIKDSFWMGRTEVTVGQWKEFVTATGYKTDAEKNGYVDSARRKGEPSFGRVDGLSWRDPGFDAAPQDNHPVSCVSWNDAVAFCEWATERERKAGRLAAGQVVRLPTEAEWEYACRAGTQTKFWWGESEEDAKGRLNGKGRDDGFMWVAPVDSFGSRGRNRFGLADMLGNVNEWCLDEWDATQAHEECFKGRPYARVLRGETCTSLLCSSRCAYRYNFRPSASSSTTGFRVAVGLAR